MKTRARCFVWRFIYMAAAGILVAVLSACTGKGGGYLPPGPSIGTNVLPQALFPGTVFTGQASFGFTFSCEDKGGANPPTGELSIQLSYTDRGTSPLLLGVPFSIHGIVDSIAPIEESMFCIGDEAPPGVNELIFLGRYRPTTSPPPGPLANCPTRERSTSPLCRFEVIVRDNDKNLAPSSGDLFSIKLSSATCTDPTEVSCSKLPAGKVFYARAGFLAGGNITVT
jgi:hypothetical protein